MHQLFLPTDEEHWDFTSSADAILAVGGLLGLLGCRAHRSRSDLAAAEQLLASCVAHGRLPPASQESSGRDAAAALALCTAAVVGRVLLSVPDELKAAQVGTLAAVTLLIAGQICTIQSACRGLLSIVDAFSSTISEGQDFASAVHDWNVVYAVCRRVSAAVQGCFLMMVMLGSAAVATGVVGYCQGAVRPSCIPGLAVGVTALQTCLWAAAVTSKCSRVVPLVNFIRGKGGVDASRMRAVHHIAHSEAGFYIFETRVTSCAVVKALYVGCAIIVSFVVQFNAVVP